MNPADFEGLYWYKLFIPCFTWGSILGTFLGPLLFPTQWFLFVAAFMIVFVLVSISQVRHRTTIKYKLFKYTFVLILIWSAWLYQGDGCRSYC